MRKQYTPDLKELHSLAERNYVAMRRLMPADADVGESRELGVGDHLRFNLEVATQARYTTDIAVTQSAPGGFADFVYARFIVRLYHDVNMAEVIGFQKNRKLTALHSNTQQPGVRKDEKQQVNKLLSDWLRLCFQQGRAASAGSRMSFIC